MQKSPGGAAAGTTFRCFNAARGGAALRDNAVSHGRVPLVTPSKMANFVFAVGYRADGAGKAVFEFGRVCF